MSTIATHGPGIADSPSYRLSRHILLGIILQLPVIRAYTSLFHDCHSDDDSDIRRYLDYSDEGADLQAALVASVENCSE